MHFELIIVWRSFWQMTPTHGFGPVDELRLSSPGLWPGGVRVSVGEQQLTCNQFENIDNLEFLMAFDKSMRLIYSH